MKAIKIIILLSVPFVVRTQTVVTGKGIQFAHGLTWGQVLEKARTENKYIFAEFYATWCGQCKAMDRDVYSKPEIGDAVNRLFISVKLQINKASTDNEETQRWYSDIDSLTRKYHVSALPTLLFFSPDGELVYKEEGYKSENEFVRSLAYVVTLKQGYEALVRLYREEKIPYWEMAKLACDAQTLGNSTLADSIAMTYKREYLDSLTDVALLTEKNVWFIARFPSLMQEGDRFFNFFYYHGSKAEQWANARTGDSREIVKVIISEDEINRHLYGDGKILVKRPNWKKLFKTIEHKYSKQYADEIIPPAKVQYYVSTKNWKKYAADFESKIRLHPPRPGGEFLGGMVDDVWALNSTAWFLFLHCSNKKVLKKALKWSELSIEIATEHKDKITQYVDTKANLLYKLGRVNDAIPLEERALELNMNSKDYKENLAKMSKGAPTWPSE